MRHAWVGSCHLEGTWVRLSRKEVGSLADSSAGGSKSPRGSSGPAFQEEP